MRVLNLALACFVLFAIGTAREAIAQVDASLSPAARTALSKLEAQLRLTARDHRALKDAARNLKVANLRVCADPGNMPLSNIKREGFQNKIAELIAREIGAKLSYFWRPYFERGLTRQTFKTNDCDVLMGIPVDYKNALTTTPLYRTTYVLVWHKDAGFDIKSLDDPLLKTKSIGVFQTSAIRTALAKRGIKENVKLHVLSYNADLDTKNQPWRQVEQVANKALDFAAVWGPFAGWRHAKGAPIVVRPMNLMGEDDIPLEFSVSLGVKKTAYLLHYKLELALEDTKDKIEEILRAYHIPLVECSRCIVQGDIPAFGVYSKPLPNSFPRDESKISADQKVTKERMEAWLSEGANLNQELANAVLANSKDRVTYLAKKGADLNALDNQGYAALHSAARHRKHALMSTLIALGSKVNQPDSDGFAPVHHAVMRNHPQSIRVLAKAGADLNAPVLDEFTPLGLAIVEDRYLAAVALIEAGADIERASGKDGLTPLMLASGKENYRPSLGAGKQHIQKLKPDDPGTLEVSDALIKKGAKVNAVSKSGVTALMLAAAHNNAPTVGLLIQAGAKTGIKSPNGKTAKDFANDNGNEAVVATIDLFIQAAQN